MPRPKLHTDLTPDKLLRTITARYHATMREIAQERVRLQTLIDTRAEGWTYASGELWRLGKEEERVTDRGIVYSLAAWIDDPTESRRVIAGRAIKQLEAAGRVKVIGTKGQYIKPTEVQP